MGTYTPQGIAFQIFKIFITLPNSEPGLFNIATSAGLWVSLEWAKVENMQRQLSLLVGPFRGCFLGVFS